MRYWKRVNGLGEATTVESYSHDLDVKGAVEIDEAEFEDFMNSLPEDGTVQRDLLKEVSDLDTRLKQIEQTVYPVSP